MSASYYITTAIDYTNAPPHLGHAYEKIAADVLARWNRLDGADVFFLTGVDEHGIKIEKAAALQGVTPEEFVGGITPQFVSTWSTLGVQYDRFIRTTDAYHEESVQRAFALLVEQGDIEKARYEGLYCAGCEEFKNERELVDGRCPQHDAVPQNFAEDNYVLRIGKYRERIREHILSHPEFIQPESRRNEVLNLLDTFPDVSVSRQKVRWGISVPGDDSQVIYVWVDALLNYITGVGWGWDDALFSRYWPASVHVVGKDIMKFHCIIWPAILMALELPLPRTIHGHGWVHVGDQKMSKSLGNAVEPNALAARYGADALRYYLMREITYGKDGTYTLEAFKLRVNADLANNLGNALNRTLGMLEKQFAGVVPSDLPAITKELADRVTMVQEQAARHMRQFEIQEALEVIWGLIDAVNKFIDTQAPWALAKAGDMEKLGGVLYGVLESLRAVTILVSPFVPQLAEKMWLQLGISSDLQSQRLKDLAWGGLQSGTQTRKLGPVYPRIEDELAEAGVKKK
ncbi:MAG: methionine--tRNA ligase [Candidatus Sericytochromatia bacterium]|nr:methionine--tRNA ligase [Candidatus Sericytochromatia bacterium]